MVLWDDLEGRDGRGCEREGQEGGDIWLIYTAIWQKPT